MDPTSLAVPKATSLGLESSARLSAAAEAAPSVTPFTPNLPPLAGGSATTSQPTQAVPPSLGARPTTSAPTPITARLAGGGRTTSPAVQSTSTQGVPPSRAA